MITITTLDDRQVQVNERDIVRVTGPYPHDPGPRTYVYGPMPQALATAEGAAALVGRLGVDPPLAELTRPNQTPVWVKGAAVSAVRAPLPGEITEPGAVNAVLVIAGQTQAVHEDVATARAIVNAHGGNV